jgi:hypothetical protein
MHIPMGDENLRRFQAVKIYIDASKGTSSLDATFSDSRVV